jgi:hypothetical protein
MKVNNAVRPRMWISGSIKRPHVAELPLAIAGAGFTQHQRKQNTSLNSSDFGDHRSGLGIRGYGRLAAALLLGRQNSG